jgi:serine/threonine protein kinase
VHKTSRLTDLTRHDNANLPSRRRATGIPTNLLAAQHRIRLDGTTIVAQSFSAPLHAGEIINGKYRVQELLGVGGVGFVVAATHLHLDDRVALKILKPEFASHPEAVRSFTVEARASFKIKSEHVARVHDVDQLPNGAPFMVMELLEGQDLRTILKAHNNLPVALTVDIALQTCEALATAHACQIVHRDVKPENLFVTRPGDAVHIKVLDFGISQVLRSNAAQRGVADGMVAVGTPPYMSPEQIRGSNDLDARADLWSLGCVLYELLTGLAPFARMSVMQSCAAVLEEEPAPIRETRPEVPQQLEDVVMCCLSKDPSRRFSNAAELAAALAPFGRDSIYCAARCGALLAKEASSSAQALSRRLPTNTGFRSNGMAGRRPTMNPLSTPAPFAVRKPSSLGLPNPRPPTPSPMPRAVVARDAPESDVFVIGPDALLEEAEEIDLDVVPGLRPTKTRWLVFAASATIALGVAYLTLSGLNWTVPTGISLHQLKERATSAQFE